MKVFSCTKAHAHAHVSINAHSHTDLYSDGVARNILFSTCKGKTVFLHLFFFGTFCPVEKIDLCSCGIASIAPAQLSKMFFFQIT